MSARKRSAVRALELIRQADCLSTLVFEAYVFSNSLAYMHDGLPGDVLGCKEIDTDYPLPQADERECLRHMTLHAPVSGYVRSLNVFNDTVGRGEHVYYLRWPLSEPVFRPPQATTDEAMLHALTDQLRGARAALQPVTEATGMITSIYRPVWELPLLGVPGKLFPAAPA